MEAIKTFGHVKNQQITIDLPQQFEGKEVEIIILSTNLEPAKQSKEAFLKFLSQGPTLSEEELKRIDDVKKEFRNWTLDEF